MLISTKEVAVLERLFTPNTPDSWRDIAITLFSTLKEKVSTVMSNEDMATLALSLTRGIADNFGGTHLYMPLGTNVDREEKHLKILELLDSGKKYAEVARAMNVSGQTVRNVQKSARSRVIYHAKLQK